MVRLVPSRSSAALLLALWAAGVTTAGTAGAQSDPLPAQPVLLNSKTASSLLVRRIVPEYPPLAKVNYIQGHVRVEVRVSAGGEVREVHVVRGHPFLAAATLPAVRRWLYRPFQTKGMPKEFVTLVDVNFSLRSKRLGKIPPAAEKDLGRQIRPPRVLNGPTPRASRPLVRLRVLVSDQGKAMDANPLNGLARDFDTAREQVQGWTFQPAQWGPLRVPWYLDVEIPVDESQAPQARAASP